MKWPNDVLARRAASWPGILVEARPQRRLGRARHRDQRRGRSRGAAARACATAPRRSGRPTAALEPTLAELLAALAARLAEPAAASLDALRARDALRGRPVRWSGGAGTGAGIDDAGALLVRLADGSVLTLDAGEVHLGAALAGRAVARSLDRVRDAVGVDAALRMAANLLAAA